MESTPLNYSCLESVLKHTDMNKRLQLKARCSSIKQLENKVPLEIDTLDLSGDHLVVNGTEYRIGIIQKYPNDQIPNYVKFELEDGGCFNDLNEFGGFCFDQNVVLMPGDIDLMKKRPNYPDRVIDESDIEKTEKEIEEYKKRLEELRSIWGKTIFSFDELRKFEIEFGVLADRPIVSLTELPIAPNSNEKIRALHDQKELILLIFREKGRLQRLVNFRDKIRPEYLVQLTIKSPTGEKRVEYGKYTGKLRESHKALLNFILGDRSCPITVQKLIVSHETVIRAPIGLKLRIRELKIVEKSYDQRFKKTFNQLKPILEESSIPLRSLEVPSTTRSIFNHEVVRTAGKLIVQWRRPLRDVLEIYTDLPIQRVITEINYTPPEHFLDFIQRWKEAGRPIGTHYSFTVFKRFPLKPILNLLQQNAISKGKNWVVIPFNEVSNLKVSRMASYELSFEVVELLSE
uniref:FTH domain-containing protein n=2 Tax=Caenorhabditis tropicalis TaxID=1561998 RepID=A0A1I7TAF5_9PELO